MGTCCHFEQLFHQSSLLIDRTGTDPLSRPTTRFPQFAAILSRGSSVHQLLFSDTSAMGRLPPVPKPNIRVPCKTAFGPLAAFTFQRKPSQPNPVSAYGEVRPTSDIQPRETTTTRRSPSVTERPSHKKDPEGTRALDMGNHNSFRILDYLHKCFTNVQTELGNL